MKFSLLSSIRMTIFMSFLQSILSSSTPPSSIPSSSSSDMLPTRTLAPTLPFTVCGAVTCDHRHESCIYDPSLAQYKCVCHLRNRTFPNCVPSKVIGVNSTSIPMTINYTSNPSEIELITRIPSSSQSSILPSVDSISSSTPSSTPPSTPSSSPSSTPSSKPSSNPSSIPSSTPSSNPSSLPSRETFFLSQVPSKTFSSLPSSIPSSVPSQIPSYGESPTFHQSSRSCSIDISSTCATNQGKSTCNSFVAPSISCLDRPFILMFRFLGGICPTKSSSSYSPLLLSCKDINGGPPPITTKGWTAFIKATSNIGDRKTVYHAAEVAVGNDFTLEAGSAKFGASTSIQIYSNNNITDPKALLQSITIASDCRTINSELPTLYLRDTIGPFQLLLFANNDQGIASTFYSSIYTFLIENVNRNHSATISGLSFISSHGTFDLDGSVNGLTLAPGDSATFNQTVLIDMSPSNRYSSLSIVTAMADDGYNCTDSDLLSFSITEPLVANSTPTSPPIGLSLPMDNECLVRIKATCIPSDQNTDKCEDIKATTSSCAYRPTVLSFRYDGGNCSKSNVQDQESLKLCRDYANGPPTTLGSQSYIVVSNSEDDSEVFYSGIVRVGSELLLKFGTGGSPDFLNIGVYSPSTTTKGKILQLLTITSSCVGTGKLFLEDQFGSLHLMVIVNEPQGVMSNFVQISYSYMATNVGPKEKLALASLTSITTFGYLDLTYAINGFVLDAGHSVRLERRFLIDATMLRRYTTITKVSAKTINGLEVCSDKEMMSFVVGEPETNTTEPHSRLPLIEVPRVKPGNESISDRYGEIQSPTEAPTTISSSIVDAAALEEESCILDIEVECVTKDTLGSGKCSDLSQQAVVCKERAATLEFLYKGGTCDQSKSLSIQSDALIECHDFQHDLSTRPRESVYILVTDPDDTSLVYLEADVSIGESFELNNTIAGKSSTTRFLIYSSSNVTQSNLIQSLVIMTDCSVKLALGESLASLKLSGLDSHDPGSATSVIPVLFLYSIRIEGRMSKTEVVSIYSITNTGVVTVPVNQSHHFATSSEEIVSFQQEGSIDISHPKKFTALTFVQTKITTSHGSRMCTKKHLLSLL